MMTIWNKNTDQTLSKNNNPGFKVNNMKYWHPNLPFGQHISVSTLVAKEKKIRKSKGTTKNRKFQCVYFVNELISKIIWRTNFLVGCLFCFLYFLWIVGIILKCTLA